MLWRLAACGLATQLIGLFIAMVNGDGVRLGMRPDEPKRKEVSAEPLAELARRAR